MMAPVNNSSQKLIRHCYCVLSGINVGLVLLVLGAFFSPRHTAHQMNLGWAAWCGGTEFPEGWQQLAHAYKK